MPGHARLDTPGTLHHVIVRGIEQRQIVDDQEDRRHFVSRPGRLASEHKTAIYAWALMTKHAHILLRSSPEGLAQIAQQLIDNVGLPLAETARQLGVSTSAISKALRSLPRK